MDQDTPIKKYPATTSEVAKMLGIEHPGKDLPLGTFAPKDEHPLVGLPMEKSENQKIGESETVAHSNAHPSPIEKKIADLKASSDEKPAAKDPAFVKFGKTALPYAAVFTVGLFLYYFFFTGVNFSALFNSAPKAATPKQTALQQLETQDSTAYQTWVQGFYYDVSDPTILDPETDNSGNGLSNFQKYLLNLNPKSYDTLGLGMPDSQTLSEGINPLTGGPLTDAQKNIVSKYVDMEVAMNRLAMYKMENPPEVAGASTSANNSSVIALPAAITPRIYESSNYTAPDAVVAPPVSSQLSINTNVPGELNIPDLKISAPINWPTSSDSFEQDLQIGVIHYPGTAMPGDIGTTYIAGHSSNYVWAKGNYNHIFTKLGNLANDTSFSITVTLTNGKQTTLHYIVVYSKQYSPTDPAQIANTGKSLVALSTCWPVNSTAKRLVVYGQLTQIEQ